MNVQTLFILLYCFLICLWYSPGWLNFLVNPQKAGGKGDVDQILSFWSVHTRWRVCRYCDRVMAVCVWCGTVRVCGLWWCVWELETIQVCGVCEEEHSSCVQWWCALICTWCELKDTYVWVGQCLSVECWQDCLKASKLTLSIKVP